MNESMELSREPGMLWTVFTKGKRENENFSCINGAGGLWSSQLGLGVGTWRQQQAVKLYYHTRSFTV